MEGFQIILPSISFNKFCRRDMMLDLFSPEVRRNPYPYYAELRRHAPVHFFPQHGFWTVSRYAEVMNVLRQPNIFSSAGAASFEDTLLGADPPAHTRVHKIVANVFSPQRLAWIEEKIRAHALRLVEQLIANGQGELMADLAVPLPITVIAELLGIDPERSNELKKWSDAVVAAGAGMMNEDEMKQVGTTLQQFHAFFVEHVENCRHHTGHGVIEDLLRSDDAGEKLSPAEAVNVGKLLLIAGNETTTNLIGNAVRALLEHPAELALVRSDLQLIPALIEETLRFDAPVQMLRRRTTKAAEIDGVMIPAAANVMVLLGSANRDEEKFPEPDRFSITRQAHGHLAFGFGPHYCLGVYLARLEARLAIEALLSRIHHIHPLASLGAIELIDSIHTRGPKQLPLVFNR
jgi:cytochrome P450